MTGGLFLEWSRTYYYPFGDICLGKALAVKHKYVTVYFCENDFY
jgi:hypothetical protein